MSMRAALLALGLSLSLFAPHAVADPCGMVPPLYTGPGIPIERIGPQKTYVFFKDGLETFVIRPGYRGKVDEFGMLIPFPTPPAIRKVPDQTFAHIAAAVDPPEVVFNLRPPPMPSVVAERSMVPAGYAEQGLKYDEVRVLRQEAVGMYEVAVLEAGSAKSLNRWMDEHGYRYPTGMDDAVNDYVSKRWCFVAVKTRVGPKSTVYPRPGMREARSQLPTGATFDGHVQAMGFRFRVEEPVVPMRLSAFNEGELRNVVYFLSEKPLKIRGLGEELVKRQLKGEELLRNLTRSLPVRIYGGDVSDVSPEHWKAIEPQRNPAPHNGVARDLFASDLLAVKTGALSHAFEEREKALLNVSERLGLRGAQIDALHEEAMKAERENERTIAEALKQLRGMTLTVIDGDFPRDFLAKNNLRFDRYAMPAASNSRERYNARFLGPEGQLGGVRVEGDGNASERPNVLEPLWRRVFD